MDRPTSEPRSVGHLKLVLAVALLTTPVLGFALPFLGLFASLMTVPLVVRTAGPVVWTLGARPWTAVLGGAALWGPPLASFAGLFYALLGEPGANQFGTTAWLLIPLCGPEAILPPTVAAVAVYALGATASAVVRRPWPWLVGGLAANAVYHLTLYLATIEITAEPLSAAEPLPASGTSA